MLDETQNFILIMIYTASSECEICRNFTCYQNGQSGKDLRPRSRFNANIIMEIAHPLFFDETISQI